MSARPWALRSPQITGQAQNTTPTSAMKAPEIASPYRSKGPGAREAGPPPSAPNDRGSVQDADDKNGHNEKGGGEACVHAPASAVFLQGFQLASPYPEPSQPRPRLMAHVRRRRAAVRRSTLYRPFDAEHAEHIVGDARLHAPHL